MKIEAQIARLELSGISTRSSIIHTHLSLLVGYVLSYLSCLFLYLLSSLYMIGIKHLGVHFLKVFKIYSKLLKLKLIKNKKL